MTTTTGELRPAPGIIGWRTPLVIIICGCAIALLSFGPRSSLGFFIQPMSREFTWGRDVFGLALALQNLLWGLGQPIAGARTPDGKALQGTMASLRRGELPAPMQPGMATTLGVIATDAMLTKAQANKVAQMAHDGFARAINPVHTASDGDTIFALATGGSGTAASITLVGALAADVMATAVVRAVRAATRLRGEGLPDLPAAGDL